MATLVNYVYTLKLHSNTAACR